MEQTKSSITLITTFIDEITVLHANEELECYGMTPDNVPTRDTKYMTPTDSVR